jgi:hypothetical protein
MRSRSWASRPACWSNVLVRPYPTFKTELRLSRTKNTVAQLSQKKVKYNAYETSILPDEFRSVGLAHVSNFPRYYICLIQAQIDILRHTDHNVYVQLRREHPIEGRLQQNLNFGTSRRHGCAATRSYRRRMRENL